MGSFKDLPKDVVWLIFRQVARSGIMKLYPVNFSLYEEGCYLSTSFYSLHVGFAMLHLALTSKLCLKVVKSKCVKFEDGWLFRRGALTV
jgi:hypothetical protein